MENKEYKLLNHIDEPADLRQLSLDELPEVCRELRQRIIDEVSVNPGHFASSLGVVELTVALHYVFDTPSDRIVWDVGHQAYGHKILTGRRDQFCTNRRLHGIKPFPSPEESPYDAFICGHASNSISAALGMAVAQQLKDDTEDRKQEFGSERSEGVNDNSLSTSLPLGGDGGGRPHRVVAVIGDGAMSGGLAFEGINNASSSHNDLLIILNDNDMSIDRAVGGMEKYLLRLNTGSIYNRLRYRLSRFFARHGMLSDNRRNGIIRLSNAFKSLISHQQNIFEGMNIRYFGPFDGHDVKEVVRLLNQLKDMRGPKLLHLHTTKGKGFEPAERSATVWHAPGKFDAETGERLVSSATDVAPRFQDVFGETLLELAKANPRIVGVTPAMPTGCSMNIMMREMPERTFDVGIAEGHAVTFSAGMAKEGLQPFCNIYSAFAQRAYDNVIHDVAMLRLPVVLCLDRAGLVGEDGPTHHGAFDMASLRAIPNLTICSPMNEQQLRNLMYTAQLPDKGTFVIRYPRGRGVMKEWHTPLEEIPIGTGRRLSSGSELAILSIGPIGNTVQEAINREELKGRVAHYDMRFLKPLDAELLREVGKNNSHVITVEDGCRMGGFGSAVMEWFSDNGFAPQITRLGLPDHFVEHGTPQELYQIVGLDAPSIAAKATEILNHSAL